MMVLSFIFWISLLGVFYAYFGYPVVLIFLGKIRSKQIDNPEQEFSPRVSCLIPVHNEILIIEEKLKNTLELIYPEDKIEFLFISDGSTDGTNEIINKYESESEKIILVEINDRKGKGNALNVALQQTRYDIIVFTDASILLDKFALKQIVNPFQDNTVGCVSGEDHIKDGGGESAYGQYELWLRNLESDLHSVVGASGSFYAQRKELVKPFEEGLAPDFLSVLNTVENGFRAITEPKAYGYMTSLKNTSQEFNRKIRTLIRGMSALFVKKSLMNIFRYGIFSFMLISHKLIRWLVPFFLIAVFISNVFISESLFYALMLLGQFSFYTLSILAYFNVKKLGDRLVGKIPLYFTMVNISILIAWKRYLSGVRQEIWNPSVRP